MKIKSLEINGVGGILNLKLDFIDGINVICGANGIGKTTVLEIISDAFIASNSKLKRNASCKSGKYNITIKINENGVFTKKNKIENVSVFDPHGGDYRTSWAEYNYKILYFSINRDIKYSKLDSIKADPARETYTNGNIIKTGIEAQDIKNWFVNRFLFSSQKDSLPKELIENYKLTKEAFGILDNTVRFKTVTANSFDIILSTQKGDIYFEYLSSGYKSCIYIIFGIIKEIEYRLKVKPIAVQKFDGIILIDEIDLHLHPLWQAGLIKSLKIIFPCAQFILTTHSPSLLQSLDKNEIIALGYDENGNTILKALNLGEYGLQGWTLEEILKDIMEMPSTSSELYQETLRKFDEAMNSEDRDLILHQYNLLKEMLHPNNSLRKLLAIQVAEWE